MSGDASACGTPDLDFKGPAKDGWEIPWPIEYKDISPYYDKVDQLIGVYGGDDDSDALPGSKFFMPAPGMRCSERLLKKAFATMDIPVVAGRRANRTLPLNGYPACHYCGNCGSGCDVGASFCSADHLLPGAIKTGKLEIRSNAVVARVLVDENGLAKGVQYFDRVTGKEHQVLAKVVVMGASAVDSTRILLNSKSEKHPNGIGNGSDVIGRYLCEQIRVHVSGYMTSLYGRDIVHDYGAGGEHIYLPRFSHRRQGLSFIRGYGMQFWNTGCQPGNLSKIGTSLDGIGADFKREVKRRYPGWVELHPFGEALPYAHNRITVDETNVDRYGVPRLKIDYEIGDNERKMADHMYDTLEEVGKRAGIEWVHFKRGELDNNGSAIHEHGCCRMGEDPKRSALNKFNQMHEAKNVFVVDGSAFTSASEKNPTLTILALSWRATDYLAEH